MDISITALCYYAVGYAFAYGESNSKFIGNANYFLIDSEDYVLWFFQFVFAGTTATIVSGSVAERCRFRAYIWYTVVLTSFVYPVTSHWIWSPQGFFYGKVLDFAGSGAVHLLGGAAVRVGKLGVFVTFSILAFSLTIPLAISICTVYDTITTGHGG
jgi:ammonium transporter, Amt family